MMSFFLNPWVMAAGVALAVSPIIIHLINRMRFRRIQWAAMEFLLKAQKKMRRKKILEQLILLLLRIFLILLAGLLFARFLGEDPSQGKESRPVLHVVILDDSPSMTDNGGGGPGGKDAFERAKAFVTEKIMPAATKANTPQTLRVLRMSDQADILAAGGDVDQPAEQITTASIDSVRARLATEKTSPIHGSLVPALVKTRQLLERIPKADLAKVVHVVSDMRAVDWNRDSDAITEAVQKLADDGVKVHLIDVSSPARKPERRNPGYSDNVGIVELKPRSRVAAYEKDIVDFELRVKNYGATDLKEVRADVFVNGEINNFVNVRFDKLPSGQEVNTTFQVTFNQSQGATLAKDEDPLARFNIVTVHLDNMGPDSIAADNVRHAVVEVREKLSVLMVTRPPDDDKPQDKDGDSFALRRLFATELIGIELVSEGVEALDKLDLRNFTSIYLVNIPQLTQSQTANLERYVKNGGGVAVFLGPNVVPDIYNSILYRKGDGMMPFPLPSDPTPPLTPEQKKKRGVLGGSTFTARILLRDQATKSHPALRGIYEAKSDADKETAQKVEATFNFVQIEQHWPIARIGKWREDRSIQELYCLPNEQSITEFEDRARRLNDMVKAKYGEAKFERYRALVDQNLRAIHDLTGDPTNPLLSELAAALDRLLADQISGGGSEQALMREFWSQPEMTEARTMAQSLRDSAKYGDPLYVSRRFGNGRVAVFTTPVAAPWTDWPLGVGISGWVAVMSELQKYLGGGGGDENRALGSAFEATFETGRYKPEVSWTYLTYDPTAVEKGARKLIQIRDPAVGQVGKKIGLDSRDNSLRLNFSDTKRPGVYVFKLETQKRGDGGEPGGITPKSKLDEYVATVFNYDTELEGDLKRVTTDELSKLRGAEEVHSLEDDSWLGVLEQKPTDLSSGRWIYLVILLVLIFEQAMAVRLSYHSKPDELEAYAPSAAAAMAGRTMAQTAGSETAPAATDGGEGPAA